MSKNTWPVAPGSYIVGDPKGPVAVCTLTSERLMSPLATLPGVAIAGMVYTANLGISRIVVNVTTNPNIRFLLICGRDSNLFQPGQSLAALADNGTNEQKRIIGASGYDPVLTALTADQVGQFRNQIELVDWTMEEDLDTLKKKIDDLAARNPGPFETDKQSTPASIVSERFTEIRPGGQREPLIYDPKGYFVITIEADKGEILLRHYFPDHSPAHEMRGRGATSMLLGLLRDGLVTQLSHAGYLGEELSKAQTALQFGLRYDQDRLLRARESQNKTDEATSPEVQPAKSDKPKIEPLKLDQFERTAPGTRVDLVLTVTAVPVEYALVGTFLNMDDAEPFTVYHKTSRDLEISWTSATKVIMGEAKEIVVGATLRIIGKSDNNRVNAEQIIILTHVTRIVP